MWGDICKKCFSMIKHYIYHKRTCRRIQEMLEYMTGIILYGQFSRGNMSIDVEQVYKQYADKIKVYIRSRVNNPTDVEDLQSEVFLKIQKKAADYDSQKAAISTWVYTIAHNTVIDYYRTNKMADSIDEEREGELVPSALIEEDKVDVELLNRETLSELAEAMETLSEEERIVIVYHYYDGITLQDIALKTGLTYGQVKLRHASALKVMKKFFTKKIATGRFTSYK